MKKFILNTLLFFTSIGIFIAGLCVVSAMYMYPKLPSMDELHNYKPKLPLQIYSEDNVLLGQFGEEKRIFISFEDTPQLLVKAILSAEDTRFYQHGGVDFVGIGRAILSDIVTRRLQSGASTITMQVARNFFLTKKKTFSRKFYEVLLSYKIEQSLTKNQILELYINQIYLGQRAYGFAEAALTYFGKPLDKLSIAEYAILAGLPKAPSAYNPIVNKKRAHERGMYVLGRMIDANFITKEEYNTAINEEIHTTKNSNIDTINFGDYVSEMVRQMMYEKYGDAIYSTGYKVHTTINSKMQRSAYSALRNGLIQYTIQFGDYSGPETQLNITPDDSTDTKNIINAAFDDINDYGDLKVAAVLRVTDKQLSAILRDGSQIVISGNNFKNIKKYTTTNNSNKNITRGSVIRVINNNNTWGVVQLPNVEGGIVALNPNNGAIKAMVGGFDFYKNKWNHVTQSMRQPGSGFKPFIYSAALEKGFTPNTIINGDPVCFSNGNKNEPWCPKNDEENETGNVTFRQALAKSLNIPTVKIMNQITPQFAIEHISQFGFDKQHFQPYLTLALGVNEVTPIQMAQAYSVFANGGYLVSPYIITTITDNDGKILAKTAVPDTITENPVITPRNAFVINNILQDAIRYGTGSRAYRELKRDDLAGKTGTTNDNKDVWFNGYTPNLVAITWVGFDKPKTLGKHAYGASVALPIWINFMKPIISDIPEWHLPMPNGLVAVESATWKNGREYLYEDNQNRVSRLTNDAQNETSAPVGFMAKDDDGNNTDSSTNSKINDINNNDNNNNDSNNDNQKTMQPSKADSKVLDSLINELKYN